MKGGKAEVLSIDWQTNYKRLGAIAMNEVTKVTQPAPSLLTKIAMRYSVEPNKMMATLKSTAFRMPEGEVSNEQMMALLVVADQYGLNPFTKEIYAFPDAKKGGVVPVVGIDGWARIINAHREFDGLEFNDGPDGKDGPAWIECVIYRKDREHPTSVREYMAECKRNTGPWGSHPRRMLRHKAMIQCARIAFSFVGIYDEDEAARIAEGHTFEHDPLPTALVALNEQAAAVHPSTEPPPTNPKQKPSDPTVPEGSPTQRMPGDE
jgi:phage recombination protein Bet